MQLRESVAVVTGASSGLGEHFSRALVDRGATVHGLARSRDKLEALAEELGERFHPHACDVADEAQVDAALAAVEDGSGGVDALINNAGLGRFGPIDELEPAAWDELAATNLRGVYLCTRRTVPIMNRQNAERGFGGHIVNIASVAGLVGNPEISAYNATKFGVRGFSEALMKELREDGIKVTCVYPGSVATSFFDVAGSSMTANPLQPEDVAATVAHLLETPDTTAQSEVSERR